MGTSSSFRGPRNNSSLLPSWADANGGSRDNSTSPNPADSSNSDNSVSPVDTGTGDKLPGATDEADKGPSKPDDRPPIKTGSKQPKQVRWSGAKNAMSRFGTNPASPSALKTAGRSYVRARGGPQGATRAAQQGVSAVAGLGQFLGDVAGRGLDQALRSAGLQDCLGKPAEEVFARLADHLAPPGGVIDEAITRKAILDSLCYLYDKLADEQGNVQNLDALGPEEVKEALLVATQYYIYQKWLNEVGITLEQKDVSEIELIDAEITVKDFVGESVRLAFSNTDVATFSFKNPVVIQSINTIFLETYTLIEL